MQELLIETIRIDGGTQSRETIDQQYVADLAEVIKSGTRLPAIEVYGDGTDVWCADGYHRLKAHLAAGKRTIRCNVHKGTLAPHWPLFFGNGYILEKRRVCSIYLIHSPAPPLPISRRNSWLPLFFEETGFARFTGERR